MCTLWFGILPSSLRWHTETNNSLPHGPVVHMFTSMWLTEYGWTFGFPVPSPGKIHLGWGNFTHWTSAILYKGKRVAQKITANIVTSKLKHNFYLKTTKRMILNTGFHSAQTEFHSYQKNKNDSSANQNMSNNMIFFLNKRCEQFHMTNKEKRKKKAPNTISE